MRCATHAPVGVRGDTDVDDRAALEGDDNECVERLEMHSDHREEVAGPNLRGVVAEKGPAGLTAATLQVLRAVLGDPARRDAPPELRKLAGNPVLAPQAVFLPHTPDDGPQLGVDRWPADPTAGAQTPPQSPRRSMPPENRRGSYHDHGFEQRVRLGRQRRDQRSVQSAESGTRRRAAEHDQLVAEQKVLGGDGRVRGEESQDGCDDIAKEVDHRAILGPVVSQVQSRRTHALSAASASSFCGAQRASLARRYFTGRSDALRPSSGKISWWRAPQETRISSHVRRSSPLGQGRRRGDP